MNGESRVSVGSISCVAWAKLAVGTLVLTALVLLLMQGYVPPGSTGEVIRNNQRNGIDATPLFYTELETATPQD